MLLAGKRSGGHIDQPYDDALEEDSKIVSCFRHAYTSVIGQAPYFSGHRGVVRYHGVLAPRARNRDRIVPTQPVAESTAADRASSAPPCGHRLRWATLLARVFSTDRSACPAGGGRLRIIAALTDPDSIRTYLQGVGRPAVPPPRAPPLPRFEFAA